MTPNREDRLVFDQIDREIEAIADELSRMPIDDRAFLSQRLDQCFERIQDQLYDLRFAKVAFGDHVPSCTRINASLDALTATVNAARQLRELARG